MIKLNALHKKRLKFLLVISIVVSSVSALLLYGLKNSINLFLTPTELLADAHVHRSNVHVGGMVKQGSVVRAEDLNVTFVVTDLKRSILVNYKGILPDLFREGKGVVMKGRLNEKGVFQAEEILAKHDEKYEPMTMQKR